MKGLEFIDKVLEDSKLTEADAERVGHEIKEAIRKRINKKFNRRSSHGIA